MDIGAGLITVQTSLATKAPLNGPIFTGTLKADIIKANDVDIGAALITVQTALAAKAPLNGPIFTGTLKADIIKANEVDIGAGLANVQTSLSALLPKAAPIYSGTLKNLDNTFSVSSDGDVTCATLYTPYVSLNGASLAQSLATLSIAAAAAQIEATSAQTSASNALTAANTAFALAQTVNVGSSSFSVPEELYISDADARDRGSIAQGKPYAQQTGLVQVSQLPPPQYYYDIGPAPFTNGKKGISMASNEGEISRWKHG